MLKRKVNIYKVLTSNTHLSPSINNKMCTLELTDDNKLRILAFKNPEDDEPISVTTTKITKTVKTHNERIYYTANSVYFFYAVQEK